MESDSRMRTLKLNLNVWIPVGLVISTVSIIASVVILFTHGLNYGVDFLGGAKFQYRFEASASDVSEATLSEVVKQAVSEEPQVVRYGDPSEHRFLIQLPLRDENIGKTYGDRLSNALTERFGATNFVLEQEEVVGPKAGQDLRNRGFSAFFIATILIMVYLAYRFDMNFAPGAVIALLHDLLIPMGVFALLGKEFNLPIVAALLTIMGYSLNDTIIIFDRIRENEKKITATNFKEIVHEAINSTLSRTLVTSFTVFMVVFVLYMMGGGALHDFAFIFLIGVGVGTYSSIFVASPCYMLLKKWRGQLPSL